MEGWWARYGLWWCWWWLCVKHMVPIWWVGDGWWVGDFSLILTHKRFWGVKLREAQKSSDVSLQRSTSAKNTTFCTVCGHSEVLGLEVPGKQVAVDFHQLYPKNQPQLPKQKTFFSQIRRCVNYAPKLGPKRFRFRMPRQKKNLSIFWWQTPKDIQSFWGRFFNTISRVYTSTDWDIEDN